MVLVEGKPMAEGRRVVLHVTSGKRAVTATNDKPGTLEVGAVGLLRGQVVEAYDWPLRFFRACACPGCW